jgi:hypothetical protein
MREPIRQQWGFRPPHRYESANVRNWHHADQFDASLLGQATDLAPMFLNAINCCRTAPTQCRWFDVTSFGLLVSALMLPIQCGMARAALGLSVRKLAAAARVAPQTIVRFERGETLRRRTIVSLRQGLEAAGVEFTNGRKPGVRLSVR